MSRSGDEHQDVVAKEISVHSPGLLARMSRKEAGRECISKARCRNGWPPWEEAGAASVATLLARLAKRFMCLIEHSQKGLRVWLKLQIATEMHAKIKSLAIRDAQLWVLQYKLNCNSNTTLCHNTLIPFYCICPMKTPSHIVPSAFLQ